jgi:hypothetical protein
MVGQGGNETFCLQKDLSGDDQKAAVSISLPTFLSSVAADHILIHLQFLIATVHPDFFKKLNAIGYLKLSQMEESQVLLLQWEKLETFDRPHPFQTVPFRLFQTAVHY